MRMRASVRLFLGQHQGAAAYADDLIGDADGRSLAAVLPE